MDVIDAIKQRRAYRSFDPVEITDELIEDFAKVAQIAPSCNNFQPWRYIFVRDKETLQELFTILSDTNNWIEKCSMMIAVFSKPKFDCMIKGRDYYLFDTGLATAFIVLRATELGLVAHPIAGFNENGGKEILGIPEEMRLITFVIIGKHSDTINPVLSDKMKLGEKQRPPRKGLKEIAYLDKYGKEIKP